AATPTPVAPRPVVHALGAIAAPSQEGRLVRTWGGVGRGVEGKGRGTGGWEYQRAQTGGPAGARVGGRRPRCGGQGPRDSRVGTAGCRRCPRGRGGGGHGRRGTAPAGKPCRARPCLHAWT